MILNASMMDSGYLSITLRAASLSSEECIRTNLIINRIVTNTHPLQQNGPFQQTPPRFHHLAHSHTATDVSETGSSFLLKRCFNAFITTLLSSSMLTFLAYFKAASGRQSNNRQIFFLFSHCLLPAVLTN